MMYFKKEIELATKGIGGAIVTIGLFGIMGLTGCADIKSVAGIEMSIELAKSATHYVDMIVYGTLIMFLPKMLR